MLAAYTTIEYVGHHMRRTEEGALLGAEVRRRREEQGMTLETLASLTELSPNYIGSVELGQRDPSLSTIVALAKGLGIHPGLLFTHAKAFSRMAEQAAEAFDQLPEDNKADVLAFLHALPKKADPAAMAGRAP